MKNYFIVSLLVAVPICFNTTPDNVPVNNNPTKTCHELNTGDIGFIQLAKKTEPGEPLTVYGQVLDKQTNQPVKNASVFLYQTDSNGIYNPSGDERNARIKGTLYSNGSGCFKIQTILPGDYPGNKNSRHLHYVINAKGYKEVTSLFLFKGFTTHNLTDQGNFIILDINKNNTGTWLATANLYLEKN